METEHYVLTADRHDGLPCTVLLSLKLRLFPGELAFNHTSRPDNQNRQRHSLWGLCSCLALSDKFSWGNRLKKNHWNTVTFYAVKVIDREGWPARSVVFDTHSTLKLTHLTELCP